MAPSRDRLPPRLLPILYFALAHAAMALAFASIAYDPRGVAGFFYHPRMLGVVHLVTLGWITGSILGSLYLVAPMAFRTDLPARWPDYTAFALLLAGLAGMASHFWIEQFSGMAWSAGAAGAGILLNGARTLPRLAASDVPGAVRAHIVLAFLNVAGASAMGVLLGVEKVHHFLRGYVLDNVYAHAHLAAIGWATMMVVGVAYRLLPMVLPAEMPKGRRLWASAVLLQAGITGLFVSFLVRGPLIGLFAVATVLGLAAFLSVVGWMLRHPRPRPPAIKAPDPARLHAAAAMASLAVAAALGLRLAFADLSPSTPRVAVAYGVFGLVGFLAQMVVAMKGRLLPIFAWYWAFANTDYRGPVTSPHEMPWRPAQHAVVLIWWLGVPALAGGLAFDAVGWVRAAALALLAATLTDATHSGWIVRRAYRDRRD